MDHAEENVCTYGQEEGRKQSVCLGEAVRRSYESTQGEPKIAAVLMVVMVMVAVAAEMAALSGLESGCTWGVC